MEYNFNHGEGAAASDKQSAEVVKSPNCNGEYLQYCIKHIQKFAQTNGYILQEWSRNEPFPSSNMLIGITNAVSIDVDKQQFLHNAELMNEEQFWAIEQMRKQSPKQSLPSHRRGRYGRIWEQGRTWYKLFAVIIPSESTPNIPPEMVNGWYTYQKHQSVLTDWCFFCGQNEKRRTNTLHYYEPRCQLSLTS